LTPPSPVFPENPDGDIAGKSLKAPLTAKADPRCQGWS